MKIKQIKSIASLKKTLDRIFKKFIRLRDCGESGHVKCISCNKILTYGESSLHAGHYVPAGVSSPLRWNEANVNAQCNTCNTFKNGNPHEYRLGMIGKYGKAREEQIWENRHAKGFYPTREWLIEKIEYYKNEVKKLEKN